MFEDVGVESDVPLTGTCFEEGFEESFDRAEVITAFDRDGVPLNFEAAASILTSGILSSMLGILIDEGVIGIGTGGDILVGARSAGIGFPFFARSTPATNMLSWWPRRLFNLEEPLLVTPPEDFSRPGTDTEAALCCRADCGRRESTAANGVLLMPRAPFAPFALAPAAEGDAPSEELRREGGEGALTT